MDRIIGNGIGRTPHVERSNMIGGMFSSKAFKLGNVKGELGWHSRPTNIVADRVIDQLIEIGETEASHVREQGDGRSSSCGGSASSSLGSSARITATVSPRPDIVKVSGGEPEVK